MTGTFNEVDGAVMIAVRDLTPGDEGRLVEYRNPVDGTGQLGALADVVIYPIQSQATIRYKGVNRPIVCDPTTLVQVYPADWNATPHLDPEPWVCDAPDFDRYASKDDYEGRHSVMFLPREHDADGKPYSQNREDYETQ